MTGGGDLAFVASEIPSTEVGGEHPFILVEGDLKKAKQGARMSFQGEEAVNSLLVRS